MSSLLLDEAIDDATKFGFDNYSAALASIIKSKNLQTPFTIAIHGDWGSGKTSLMKTIARKLEQSSRDEAKVKAVWFKAWEFEKVPVPLWKVFLNRITMELQDMVGDTGLKAKIKAVGKGLLLLSSDLLLERYAGVPLEKIEGIKEKVWDDIKKINSLSEDLSGCIEAALKNDPLKRDRLVVFIDDLDRCLPEQCVEVFESIKLFLNSKNCVFVVGINKEQIRKAFEIKFGKEETSSGLFYMEKFVQLQFDLPRKTSMEIQSFLMELASEQLKRSPKTLELISRFIEPNPRKIKRWINSVLFLEELFKTKQQRQILKSEVDVSIVSIWLFLKSFFPDFSVLVERDLSLLNTAIRVASGKGSEEDEKKIGDFSLDRRLNEFLSILEPRYAEDLLEEVVYLSKLTPLEEVSALPTQMLERIVEIPEEELSEQFTRLTEYGASVLADRIIERLDQIRDWDEYKKNLKTYEILDLLFTTAEKDSKRKLMFGKIFDLFMRNIFGKQYFASKMKDYTSSTAVREMVVKEGYLDGIVDVFAKSNSFEEAKQNSAVLLNFVDDLTPKQIRVIVKASIDNDQIYYSFGARGNLPTVFSKHKSGISAEEINKIKELMHITIT